MQKFLIILAIVVAGCKDAAKEENALVKSLQPATTPKLFDLDSNDINLERFRGKTVVLNFWATWCKPCLVEMPSIKNAQDELGDKGVVFLLASNESLEEIREFKMRIDLNLHFVHVSNVADLNIAALPTTFIYNRRGELVHNETGVAKWDDLSHIGMILKINNPQ